MRRSIVIPGVSHSNPIPAACLVGNLLASSLITGRDPVTNTLPPTFETQCDNMFSGVRAVVEGAGGRLENIVRITIWVEDRDKRAAINKPWTTLFPDPDRRPARLTLNRPLEPGKLLECEFLAVLELPSFGRSVTTALRRLVGGRS